MKKNKILKEKSRISWLVPLVFFGNGVMFQGSVNFGLAYLLTTHFTQEYAEVKIGVIIAIGSLCDILLTPLFGYLSDKQILFFKNKHFLVLLGGLVASGSLITMPFISSNIALFQLFWVFVHIGASLSFSSTQYIYSIYVETENYNVVSARISNLSIVGALLGTVMNTYFVKLNLFSINYMFVVPAIIGLSFSFLLFFYLTNISLKVKPVNTNIYIKKGKMSFAVILQKIKHDRNLYLLFLFRIFFLAAIWIVETEQYYYIKNHFGISEEFAVSLINVVYAVGIVGAVIGALLSTVFFKIISTSAKSLKTQMFMFLVLLFVDYLIQAHNKSIIVFFIMLFLVTFINGYLTTVSFALIPTAVRTTKNIGFNFAVFSVSENVAITMGSGISSRIMDVTHSFSILFYGSATTTLLAIFILSVINMHKVLSDANSPSFALFSPLDKD